MIPESSESARLLAGKCRCGAVHYEVSDAFLYAANCHCSECRAATGSAFKAFAGIEREKLTITEGVDELAVFGEEDLNDILWMRRPTIVERALCVGNDRGDGRPCPLGVPRFVGQHLVRFRRKQHRPLELVELR